MANISQQILRRARGHGKGRWIFSATDFLDLGSRAAVDQALSRLVKAGNARRVKRGLYDLPRIGKLLKKPAPPSLDAAVAALARRDNIRILPDGMDAANKLGLTNAVPAKARFLTDGRTRTVSIRGRTLQLRHASPKVMYWADRPAALAVQALRWLGPDAAGTSETRETLRRRLPDDVKADLARGAHLLPGWAAPVVQAIVDEEACVPDAPGTRLAEPFPAK